MNRTLFSSRAIKRVDTKRAFKRKHAAFYDSTRPEKRKTGTLIDSCLWAFYLKHPFWGSLHLGRFFFFLRLIRRR